MRPIPSLSAAPNSSMAFALAESAAELFDNRRGAPELLATPALALEAIIAAGQGLESRLDRDWARATHPYEGHLRGPVEPTQAGVVVGARRSAA